MDRDALNNSSSSVGSVGSAIASSARPPGRPPVGIHVCHYVVVVVYRGPAAGHDNIWAQGPQGLPVSSGSRLLAQKRRSRFAMRVRRSRSQS